MNKPVNQSVLRELLNEQFARRRLKNPAYSIRAFSQRLGVNHSALSEIINGKRKVGPKLGRRLADSLMLEEDLRRDLFLQTRKSARDSAVLEADRYKMIADWYHFAILSLAETKGFKSDVQWIARRLEITASQAKEAVGRLVRLGLMKQSRSRLTVTGRAFSSPDHVSDTAVRQTHHQYLEMAQAALERGQIEQRDFTAMTMAIDPAKLPEAKRRIREFRDELCAFLESDKKTEVFELCLQLFPLSKEV